MCLMAAFVPHRSNKYFHVTASNGIVSRAPYTPLAIISTADSFDDPIPEWLGSIIEKVEVFGGRGARIGQVLCTEYDIGVGIGWHRDKP
jgi:hypothetical protein